MIWILTLIAEIRADFIGLFHTDLLLLHLLTVSSEKFFYITRNIFMKLSFADT